MDYLKKLPGIVILFSITLILIMNACNQVDPKTGTAEIQLWNTGGNPVIKEGSADPSVRVFNDRVYIYPSHDFSRDNDFWIMKDWKVYSSVDLINFTDHGIILKGTDASWAAEPDHCWAPDCIEANGKYYFYFPLSDVRGIWKAEIGVGVADTPFGPYRDALGKPLIGKEDKPGDYTGDPYNIDPAVFRDDDGRAYLFWGNGHCFMAELNEDMISLRSDIIQIQIENHEGYREGPFVWKRNDLYYILYSKGGGTSYDELDYATSTDIRGPYQFRGTIIGHGMHGNEHGSVFQFRDQWYVAYHDLFPTDKYRKTCLEIIHYRNNGEIVHARPSREGVGWYNATKQIEAENYFEKSVKLTYQEHDEGSFHISRVRHGSWLKFPNVKMPFNFQDQFMARVASGSSGGRMEIILDSLNGEKLGELIVRNTGGWQSWQTLETELDHFTGTKDIYLKFTGEEKALFNLDWFRFN